MKSRMIVKFISFIVVISTQQLHAGGSILQFDIADSSKYYPVKWTAQQFPIVWHLSSDGYPGSGIDNSQLTVELEQAFNTWSALDPAIAFTNGNIINENAVGIDGINLLTFTDQDYLFPSGVSAFAVNYTFSVETTITDSYNDLDGDNNRDLPNGVYPAGTIYESDIVFNTSAGFEISGNYGSIDIRSIAIHEIGHLLGLTHSLIEGSVMEPFLSQDISDARILKQDDIAHLYNIYSNSPIAYGKSSISGKVVNGYTGEPIVGAHVFLTDPNNNGKKIVGAYSLLDGEYLIPGVQKGYVGIEPLDGSPPSNDPARINEIIKNTFDIDFITEFYDANEANVETSPSNAQLIDLETFPDSLVYSPATNINVITNSSAPPGVGMVLNAGLNLFSYPVQTQDGFSAFDLLQAFGGEAVINSIDKYNLSTGLYERAFWLNASPAGVNFSIKRGEAYLVHMQVNKNVTFEGVQDCPTVKTKAGFNLIGVPCPPPGYSAFDLLTSLGGSAVSIKRYDSNTTTFTTALAVVNGTPTGDDFSIDNGVGYIVEMLTDKGEVSLDDGNQNFPAYISGISPGRAVTGSRVSISGLGFSEELTANQVIFNGARAAVDAASVNILTVTVPNTATTGPVTVGSGGATSNPIDFIVEPRITTEADVAGKDLVDGQTVQGELSNNAEQDRYTFVATKGSYVTATALSVNPSVPDLLLFLEGPSGEILAMDDNSAGGNNPVINRFKLNRTGRHTIVVASVKDTGAGQYTFSLKLENVPPIKDISILTGDTQNGLMGTQLNEPLELYVSGPDGHAMAGVPVTLTTDDDSVVVSDSFTAATYQFITNSSGIVVVNISLPNVAGEYKIDIIIPGYPIKTITASSLPSLPVVVEASGNGQKCNSTGCTVGEEVDEPYQLKFLDSDNMPVSGVITKFEVVSGEGSLVGGASTIKLTSDDNGIVKVTHKLGNILVDAQGNTIHQIVAATSNIAGAEIKLFEPVVKAAPAVKISSVKTASIQMAMGTAVYNAINIKVLDQYDNPVPNAPISFVPVGGLELIPGSINGVNLPEMATNDDGVFIGTLQAPFNSAPVSFYNGGATPTPAGTVNYGISGVAPTIDEFGARVTPPYKLLLSAGDNTTPLTIDVDVNMAPKLVIISESDGGLNVDDKQWIGKDYLRPLKMKVISYQRTDRCESLDGTTDADLGDWRDEPFNIEGIRSFSYFNIDVTYTVTRQDEEDDTSLVLTPTLIAQTPANSVKVSTEFTPVDNNTVYLSTGIEPVDVYSGEVSGQINVTGITDPYTQIFSADTVCLLSSDSPPFNGVAYPNGVHLGVQQPQFSESIVPPISNHISLFTKSPTITILVSDGAIEEPTEDPYIGLRSAIGVDISSVKVTLNGTSIFDGATGIVQLGSYPNFIELKSDDVKITSTENQILDLLGPMNFEIKYQPTVNELNLTGTNEVVVTEPKDKVGNVLETPAILEFTMP